MQFYMLWMAVLQETT